MNPDQTLDVSGLSCPLPMLRASLLGDAWFAQHWEAAASVEQGLGG